MSTPICQYCGNRSERVSSSEIYRSGSYGDVFMCRPCKAWTGIIHGEKMVLADAELRAWRRRAHEVFDPIWKSGGLSRGTAYSWLAKKLGMTRKECHFGMFDLETCVKAVMFCREFRGVKTTLQKLNERKSKEKER